MGARVCKTITMNTPLKINLSKAEVQKILRRTQKFCAYCKEMVGFTTAKAEGVSGGIFKFCKQCGRRL